MFREGAGPPDIYFLKYWTRKKISGNKVIADRFLRGVWGFKGSYGFLEVFRGLMVFSGSFMGFRGSP